MRIAIFHNLPSGGALRTVYEQVRYLSKKHKLDLYSITNVNSQKYDFDSHIENIFTYEFTSTNKFPGYLNRLVNDIKNLFYLRLIYKKVASDIDANNYDVVLAHSDLTTESPFILRYLKTPKLLPAP